jgi:hypothetical protein
MHVPEADAAFKACELDFGAVHGGIDDSEGAQA